MKCRPAVTAALFLVLLLAQVATGQAPPPGGDYRDAPFVAVSLGEAIQEHGLRLVQLFADGRTAPVATGSGRRSLPGPAGERFFYFDVDDGYVYGGVSEVSLTIMYYDVGRSAIYLDYDAHDPNRPFAPLPAFAYKRVLVATRQNTEGWRFAEVKVADARFKNGQNGADFRIGSRDELILLNVNVRRLKTEQPLPPITVTVDGTPLLFDVPPTIENGRVLVPLRIIFEALGATVDWDGATQTVRATKGETSVELTIGKTETKVNGKPGQPLDVPAKIQDGRTLVPLRYVSEALGARVEWNGETRAVTVESAPPPPPPGPDPFFELGL